MRDLRNVGIILAVGVMDMAIVLGAVAVGRAVASLLGGN